ncbi:MAG: hypothetical protein RR691_01110 [Eubacterium sp.]
MNQNNYHIKKRIGHLEAALLGNLIYIMLVLLFKTVLNFTSDTGHYNIIFGILFFVFISVYWIGFNWLAFRKTLSQGKKGYYYKYMMCSMLPIFVLTVISSCIITVVPQISFGTSWSGFAFFVAPTIFWFLPYGLIFHFIGNFVPIILYFVICFVYIVILQIIGIALGSGNRKILRERQMDKMEQKEAINPIQNKKPLGVEQSVALKNQKAKKKTPAKKKHDSKDPFGDEDQTQIIYTEAFSVITDEMIAEADAQKNQKTKSDKPETEAVKTQAKDQLTNEIDIDIVKRTIRESQQGLNQQIEKQEEKQESSSPLAEKKSETQSISAELEHIRSLIDQEDKSKRK